MSGLQSGHNFNLTEFIIISNVALGSTILILLFCEFGEMVTHQYNLCHEKFGAFRWYLFPIKLQQMLVIVMATSQQPVVIHGFANTVCTRDAFKKVNGFVHLSPNQEKRQNSGHEFRISTCFFIDNQTRIYLFNDTSSNRRID